jgi:PAS domain S-box-containing protein
MSPNGIKPLKILIVEDDLIDRKQLERLLSKSVLSFREVKHTEYLETALELLDQDDFDIVLMDLNLTDSKGLDTLAEITEKHPRVANIVITALDREGYNLKAIAKGAQDYLIKGEFDVRMLSKSIYYAIERKKAELAMREREMQYRLLFESSNEAIFIVKGEHILDCNPSTLRMFGCTKKQIVGHPFLQFYPELQPDGQNSTEKAWEKINLALERKTQLFEWRCKRYDGTPFDAEVSLNPLELSGKVLLQAMVRDITDRKAAEEGLNRMLLLQQSVNSLQQSLLKTTPLEDKLKRVTDDIVNLFDADFCRIWLIRNGDLCEQGCIHAEVKEGPHVCQYRDRCLHLVSSSGRYTHIDGNTHRRVPFGCYKIGRVASGEDHKFLTNDAQNDPRVHNHQWASELGLVSFAGYQLRVE